MSDFKDIKIVKADEELTHAPDPQHPAMYDVYLELSDAPPIEWAQLFDQEWHVHLYSMKRRARVNGDHLVIYCALEEIEKYHKGELNTVLARVNERYRKFAVEQAIRQKQSEDLQTAAEQRKRDTLGGIRFD